VTGSTAVGRRDYAILLLLARLGLRAVKSVRLTLKMSIWENARITVCGKVENGRSCRSRRMSHEPLRVICAMIGRDAPVVECSSANKAPIDGFKSGRAISEHRQSALAKAGVVSARRARTYCAIQSGDGQCSAGAPR